MPIPINPQHESLHNNDMNIDTDILSKLLDTGNKKKKVHASKENMELLINMWKNCKSENGKIKIDSSINNSDIRNLEYFGLIEYNESEKTVTLTSNGKYVLKTQVLSESNNFLKTKKQKNYKEIIA